jgi:hypothetical protein
VAAQGRREGVHYRRNIRNDSTFNHGRTIRPAVEDDDMLAPPSGLLRTGLALKLNQVKLATRSYLRDRSNQATDSVTSYAVAAGLFAAAAIFLVAACLVGIMALFRWVEIEYGRFPAFGAIGALLIVIAGICAALAASRLKRKPRQFPTLSSRLRVAVKASPLKPDQFEAARDTAAAVLLEPSAPGSRGRRQRLRSQPLDTKRLSAGLLLIGSMLGWAAVRRRQQAQSVRRPPPAPREET